MNAPNDSKKSDRIGARVVACVLTVFLVIIMSSCERSVQRGKFTANGTFSVKTNLGRYVEINGSIAGSSDRKPLLRILTVFRNGLSQDDLSEAHREFESVIEFAGKDHKLQVTWDRQTDQVLVAGSSWDRSRVNLIACVFDGKSWSVFGGYISPDERNAKAIEEAIRGELSPQIPEVNLIKFAGVKFPEL